MKKLQPLLLILTFLLSASYLTKAADSKLDIDNIAEDEDKVLFLEKIDACITSINDLAHKPSVYNCFIDNMIEKEKNKNKKSPFFEELYEDVHNIILSFVPTKDLVACSHTCPSFYRCVNRFDHRHDLLKAVGTHAFNKISKLQKDYPNLKELERDDWMLGVYDGDLDPDAVQRDKVRQTITKLLEDFVAKEFTSQLREIIDENTVCFIVNQPVLRSLFLNNPSSSTYLLNFIAEKAQKDYKKLIPFSIPLSVYLNVLHTAIGRDYKLANTFHSENPSLLDRYYSVLKPGSDIELKIRCFLVAPVINNKAEKIDFLVNRIGFGYEDGKRVFLYCLDTLPSAVLRMSKYGFYCFATHSLFLDILRNKDFTPTLFGILAKKYPSAESIDETDKRGLDYFILNYRETIKEYIHHNTDLFGEMAYFIEDRGLDPTFLDKYIEEVRSDANTVSLDEVRGYIRENLLPKDDADSDRFISLGKYEADIQAHFKTQFIVKHWTPKNEEDRNNNKAFLAKLESIQANLAKYKPLGIITAAYTAFLASYQQV